jgi:hypothetical protein
MGRLLGVVAVGATVLAVGPAKAERSPEETYLGGVRGSLPADLVDEDLIDEVINREYSCRLEPRQPFSSGGICRPDRETAVGLEWLHSERRLRRALGHFADDLETLDPPDAVAALHEAWISSLHGCSRRLRGLESVFQPIDNLDVIDAFEKKVAREMDWCLDRFAEILPAFEEKGYVFTRGSRPETG